MLTSILLTSLLFFSICFLSSSHPLSAGLMLILSTIFIAILATTITKSFWLSYILILIFVGGMLILFIYLISLTPNQKFNFSSNLMLMFFILLIVSLMNMIDPILMTELNNKLNSNLNNFNYQTIKLFNSPSNMFTILSINYLFLVMIAVTKITSSLEGPMRSTSYV